MYEKILIAIDQSPVAERVIAAAQELAQLAGGEARVLHLREHELAGRAGLVVMETSDETQQIVDSAVATLAARGIKVTGLAKNTVFGHAAKEIIEEAQEFGAGVIVLGSRGHGDLAGLFLGSTAHKVIHLTDRPVLVVR